MITVIEKQPSEGFGTFELKRPLVIGRQNGSSSSVTKGTDVLALNSNDSRIQQVQGKTGQLIIQREGSAYYVEDQNPGGNCAFVKGELFEKRKLLINDRISVGDEFHFHFDGRNLTRVDWNQGAKLIGSHLEKVYSQFKLFGKSSEVHAVSDVSLTVEPNEFVGILGPSGCGKSTLLNILSGALKPSSGAVTINGLDIYRSPKLVRSMIGVVPQDDIVHSELKVEDAVSYSARLRLGANIPKPLKDDLAVSVLSDLGLHDWRRNRIDELSGGQRKRVSIAVEVLKNCDVLFLDEPSSGLDPATEEDLMNQLRELANNGRTILCTTHVLDRAHLFDKIVFMARGKVMFCGTFDETLNHFNVDSLLDVYKGLQEPGAVRQIIEGNLLDLNPLDEAPNLADGSDVIAENDDSEEDEKCFFRRFEKGILFDLSMVEGREDLDFITSALKAREKNVIILVSEDTLTRELLGEISSWLRLVPQLRSCLSIVGSSDRFRNLMKSNRCQGMVRLYQDLPTALLERQMGEDITDRDSVLSRGHLILLTSVAGIFFLSFLAVMWTFFFQDEKPSLIGNVSEESGVNFASGNGIAKDSIDVSKAPNNLPLTSTSEQLEVQVLVDEALVFIKGATTTKDVDGEQNEEGLSVDKLAEQEDFRKDILQRINDAIGYEETEKAVVRTSIREASKLAKVGTFSNANQYELTPREEAELLQLVNAGALSEWLEYVDCIIVVLGFTDDNESSERNSFKMAERVCDFFKGPLCKISKRCYPVGMGIQTKGIDGSPVNAFEIWVVKP